MSFLTTKILFLPAWGWIATAGAGSGLLWYKSRTSSDGSTAPGGQTMGQMDATNAFSATIENQNLGWDAYPVEYAYGPLVSYSDPSFFGEGPLSLWTAGPMEYTDIFGGYGGRRNHRGRDRRRYRGGLSGFGGSRRDLFDSPPGAGGFGYHHPKGPGFPPAPAGGEGFDNAGQNVTGFGGGPAHGGGMPFPQQTTIGANANSYIVQSGDTLAGIAAKLWGAGSDFSAIATANAGVTKGKGPNVGLAAGLTLTIPGAPSQGPAAPGGPAGNGVGGGSIGANGLNYGSNGTSGDYPGAQTSNAGASGGGSPSAGQSWSNSSRVKSGNKSSNYAVGGGQSGVQTTNNKKTSNQRPARNRPSQKRR